MGIPAFRSHYADQSITKRDIFHYIYAVLHHPSTALRYAANLRRELPRIPFVGTNPNACHPEVPSFGAEGSLQSVGGNGAPPQLHRSFGPSKTRASG